MSQILSSMIPVESSLLTCNQPHRIFFSGRTEEWSKNMKHPSRYIPWFLQPPAISTSVGCQFNLRDNRIPITRRLILINPATALMIPRCSAVQIDTTNLELANPRFLFAFLPNSLFYHWLDECQTLNHGCSQLDYGQYPFPSFPLFRCILHGALVIHFRAICLLYFLLY